MRYKALAALFCLFLITGVRGLFASHIAGAEISYKLLNGNRYLFTLKVYRDCRECKFNNSGGGENTSNCNDVPDLVIKGALGTSYATSQLATIETVRRSITDLTPACYGAISKCRPGSGISYGYEVHTFEGVYDFGNLLNSGFCRFDVSVSMSSRSTGINTMMSEQNFFNYAMLNLCEGIPNESVRFGSTPAFFYYLNQTNQHSPGLLNTDQDSLSFSLRPALVNRNLSVTYATGRSGEYPFSYYCASGGASCAPNLSGNPAEGFFCSRSGGDIVFTPVQINQGGVLVLECEEWKKNTGGVWYLAGVTRRDIYADVITNANNLPRFRNLGTEHIICEGQPFQLEVNMEDPALPGQPADTVHAWISSAPEGVTLDKIQTNTAPWFRYVLKVDPAGPGPGNHAVTISARDNYCPLNGMVSKTISLKILRSRTYSVSHTVRNCGMLEAGASVTGKNLGWTLKDRNNNILKQQVSRKLTHQLLTGGTYILESVLPAEPGYCEVKRTDTLIVESFRQPELDAGNDITVCSGEVVSIQAKTFATYGPYELSVNGTPISGFPYKPDFSSSAEYQFRVTQQDGCFAEDKIKVSFFPALKRTVKNDTICVNDVFPKAIGNVTFSRDDVYSIDYGFHSASSTVYKVNNHIWNFELLRYEGHRIELYSLTRDKNSCVYRDTSHIAIVEPEPVEVNCPDKICVNARPYMLETRDGGTWECVNYPALVKGNTLRPDRKPYGTLILKYNQVIRCLNSKTFMVQPMDTTPLTFGHPADITLCENHGPFELKGLPSGGTWTGQHTRDGSFHPAEAPGKRTTVTYTYTNTNGCVSGAPVFISSEKLPVMKVKSDKERVCVGDLLNLQALTSQQSPGYWYTDGYGSFEEPASVLTVYQPSEKDLEKGKLRFTYTLQTNGVCGNVSSFADVLIAKGPVGKILENYPAVICEPARLTFSTDYTRLEKQYWFINDSMAEEFDYNFDLNTVLKAGEYVIKTRVYDSTCEALSISKPVTVLPRPKVQMISNPSERVSREYPRLYLRDMSECPTGHRADWYYNNNYIGSDREFYYRADEANDTFHIKLLVTSGKGECKDSQISRFVFAPANILYIPDAFSPDSKGPEENNFFRVRGPAMKSYLIEIFNKYGEKVYVSSDMNAAWDGTYKNENCMQGVYFYKIITTDYDGINRDYSGTVTLIR